VPERGKYIVIEGTDGTGKSTQASLIARKLNEIGIETVEFHEPDGVEISHAVREVIKNGSLARTAFSNVLLFSVSRRENWLQQGKQALEMGKWLISARDYTSTLVYQGYGEGIDLSLIEHITLLSTDEDYIHPDHRIILDIDDEAERSRRIVGRGPLENPDTFESRDDEFQQRLIEGYRTIAAERNFPIIPANQPPGIITDQIWQIIR